MVHWDCSFGFRLLASEVYSFYAFSVGLTVRLIQLAFRWIDSMGKELLKLPKLLLRSAKLCHLVPVFDEMHALANAK